MSTPNSMATMGSTISRIITLGMAPMKGPKKGMTLVTPTTTLMSSAKGILNRLIRMKQSTPIMALSISLP